MPRTQKVIEVNRLSLSIESLSVEDDWIVGAIIPPAVTRLDFAPTIDPMRAIKSAVRNKSLPRIVSLFFAGMPEPPSNILENFHKIAVGNVGQALDFYNLFGVFNDNDLLLDRRDGFEVPQGVRKVWSRTEKRGALPFASPLQQFWEHRERIQSLLRIWIGLKDEQTSTLADACLKIGPSLIARFAPPKDCDYQQMGYRLLMTGITAGLGGVQLGMFARNQLPTACIASIGTCDALYLELLLLVSRKEEMRECPRCRSLFKPSRPSQSYCTSKCQAMAKRYRQLARTNEPD